MSFEYWALAILGGCLLGKTVSSHIIINKLLEELKELKNSIEEKKDTREVNVKDFYPEDESIDLEDEEPLELDEELEYYRDLELKRRGE